MKDLCKESYNFFKYKREIHHLSYIYSRVLFKRKISVVMVCHGLSLEFHDEILMGLLGYKIY